MEANINIHSVIPSSEVNGPGKRMVVFFQGCNRGCPGCFNPSTHSLENKTLSTCSGIFERYLNEGVEGLTVSGGEPFLQPAGLRELLKTAGECHGLSTVVYTGFLYEEIAARKELGDLFDYVDVLIDGAYVESKKESTTLARGSSNQRFHFLSGRYGADDFKMPGRVEITIGEDGVITGTGFEDLSLLHL